MRLHQFVKLYLALLFIDWFHLGLLSVFGWPGEAWVYAVGFLFVDVLHAFAFYFMLVPFKRREERFASAFVLAVAVRVSSATIGMLAAGNETVKDFLTLGSACAFLLALGGFIQWALKEAGRQPA